VVAAGLAVIGLFVLIAAFADVLTPYPPDTQLDDGLDSDGMPLAPCRQFLLGTDNLGRDVLTRVLHGTRISLTVGTVAMLTALIIGVLVGLYAGYYGGLGDTILMRGAHVMLSLPALLLGIALAWLVERNESGKVLISEPVEIKLERGLLSVCLVIGVVSWTSIARVVRAQVLSLKERSFVEAARAIGCSDRRILWRHILPNVLPAIVVLAT